MKIRATLATILFGAAIAVVSHADPILGGQIYATGGDVQVTFVSSDAGYDNLAFLSQPANALGTIFEGHSNVTGAPGYTVDLGTFSAGTLLVFALNNQQGNTWYTGDASGNVDQVAHAIVDGTVYGPGMVYVGFEDLYGGGDKDYNDLEFKVSNATTSVPDATGTMALFGIGLVGLLGFRRRFGK